jgi:hypothetical protein
VEWEDVAIADMVLVNIDVRRSCVGASVNVELQLCSCAN